MSNDRHCYFQHWIVKVNIKAYILGCDRHPMNISKLINGGYLQPLLTWKLLENPLKWSASLFFWFWLENQWGEQLCIMFWFKTHSECGNDISNCYWWHQGKNFIVVVCCPSLMQRILLNPCSEKVLQNLHGETKRHVNCIYNVMGVCCYSIAFTLLQDIFS